MVETEFEKNQLKLNFSEKELKELELPTDSGFEVVKAKKGVWVLMATDKKSTSAIDESEQKIIGLLKKLELKDRVEGKFESTLSQAEQITFKKMLLEKKVEKFKLNESYKKAVYKLFEPKEKSSETNSKKQFDLIEKKPEDYSLETDGFVIAKTEFAAQNLSAKLGERIKQGKVKGTRAFSGEFFIIDTRLFNQKSNAVIEFLKANKRVSQEDLNSALKMPPTLIKIICTFLAEDGLILERRKGQFQFIE